MLTSNDVSGHAQATGAQAAMQAKGITLKTVFIPATAFDATSEMEQAVATKPDALLLSGYGATAGPTIKAYAQLGIKIPTYGTQYFAANNLSQVAPASDYKGVTLQALAWAVKGSTQTQTPAFSTFFSELQSRPAALSRSACSPTSSTGTTSWWQRQRPSSPTAPIPPRWQPRCTTLRPRRCRCTWARWITRRRTTTRDTPTPGGPGSRTPLRSTAGSFQRIADLPDLSPKRRAQAGSQAAALPPANRLSGAERWTTMTAAPRGQRTQRNEYAKRSRFLTCCVRAADAFGDAEALVFPEARFTFTQLRAEAELVAAGLYTLGVRPGDRVGILMPNTPDFVHCFYGAAMLGAVVLPINARYKRRELRYIIADAELTVLLTTDVIAEHADYVKLLRECFPELVAAADPRHLELADAPWLKSIVLFGASEPPGVVTGGQLRDLAKQTAQKTVSALRQRIRLRDVAMMMYTSGTTANPKGCPITHEALVRVWLVLGRLSDVRQGDRFWVPMPMFHVSGLGPLLFVPAVGATYISLTHFDPVVSLRQIREERPTQLWPLFPFILMALLRHPDYDPQSLERVRSINHNAPAETGTGRCLTHAPWHRPDLLSRADRSWPAPSLPHRPTRRSKSACATSSSRSRAWTSALSTQIPVPTSRPVRPARSLSAGIACSTDISMSRRSRRPRCRQTAGFTPETWGFWSKADSRTPAG